MSGNLLLWPLSPNKQIRNLEIRLERYANNDKNHQEACAQWRERQNYGGGEDAAGGMEVDFLQPHTEPPLLPARAERGREEPLLPRNDRENTTTSSRSNAVPTVPAALRELAGAMFTTESRKEERVSDGPAAGSGRAAFCRFRHSCAALGAKAARAGGDAVAAAAAAASEATKEAVQSTTTAVVRDGTAGSVGTRTTENGHSLSEINGGVEEYWGSDYCTSV